jgi:hypothetical protein
MTIRFADMHDATAALIEAALAELELTEPGPSFTEYVGLDGWRRSSQETLVLVRRQGWRHPVALSSYGWWDRLAPMDAFRKALAGHPELSSRVDTLIGFEFSAIRRPLTRVLTMQVLTSLVEATRSYVFDRATFAEVYARVEAGLLTQTVRLLQLVPLLGFETALQTPVTLASGLVIRLMEDVEISAALQAGLPDHATSSPTSRTVPQTYQRALVKVSSYPIRVGEVPGPIAAPASIEQEAMRLQIASRLVCGGSVTLGRPLQMQYPGDFDADRSYSASLTRIEVPDENRPTILYSPGQVAEVEQMMVMLTDPAVTRNRSLQMAIRRLVSSGSRGLAEDRLVDLTVAAEALFIHGAGHGQTQQKSKPIADRATVLLGNDPEFGASAADISSFIRGCYMRRNHEVHADPTPPAASPLLDGTPSTSLDAIVQELEHLMRRAVTLSIKTTVSAAQRVP